MKSTTLIAVAALMAIVATCSNGALLRGEGSDAVQAASPAPLPEEGVYNSCEIDTALTTTCEQEDAAMASDGFKWEINYIGLMANKTGPESLKALFTYDASIGMGQVIVVSRALSDPSGNPLTGTNLTSFNGDTNLAKTCGATNNEQIILCIDSVANSVPGFEFQVVSLR